LLKPSRPKRCHSERSEESGYLRGQILRCAQDDIARRRLGAFTLVEITIAVVILALLTSAVAMSFAEPLKKARARDAAEMVQAFDQTSRAAARRSGKMIEMTFDLFENSLARRERDATTSRSQLPGGYVIDRFRSADRNISSGEAVVTCAPMGISRSYALRLRGPGLDRWIVFAGLTGQISTVQDEDSLNAIFASPARHDAH
jgi:type II secretory pathway pseudopilin PulG